MATSRPFTYNPNPQIPGTEKFGDLTVGFPTYGFESTGLQWWNGPDEELGYVIAQTNVDNNVNPLQPTQIPNVYGSVGFFRTDGKNTTAFINLTNAVSGQNFTTATQCKTWLESNNRWTSWSDFATEAIVAFKTRVLGDSGNFEAETNLKTQLNTLGSTLFDSASLIITPNAYKEGVLFAVKPDKVGTNLLLQSEGFTQAPWVLLGAPTVNRTANAGTSPIGTNNATLLTSNSTSTFGIRQSVTISPNTQYVFSCWVRSDNPTEIRVDISDLNIKSFNLTDTWQRIQVLGTYNNSYAANLQFVDIVFGPNQLGSSFFIWGAQLELGSTATDYISTTDRAIINGTIGDLTVTRATTATRVNEQGLIETVPYNILSYSEDFSNSYWVKPNYTVVPNSGISPIGTMTASLIVPSISGTTDFRNTTVFGVGGETHIWSCYIKSNGLRYVSLTAWNSDGPLTFFDLQNGTVVAQYGPPSTAKITNVGNGWYLCEVSRVLRKDYLGIWLRIGATYLNGSNLNGSNGYLIWGAQVVRSNEAKPYQLTTNRLNIPRIDYTTGNPTILVEPQRTNLILQSEDFTNGWAQEGTSVSGNTQTSPDGALTADSIFELGTNDVHRTYRSAVITVTANQLYSASFFVKKNNIRWVRVVLTQNGSTTIWAGAQFDLDTKTFTSQVGIGGGVFSSASITSLANGWYRINVVGSIPGTGMFPVLALSNGSALLNTDTRGCSVYLGNVNNGLYVWGGQLELGSSSTSYIPTTTSTVTRNADVISNTNVSNLIGQAEGTILIKGVQTTRGVIFRLRGTTTTNSVTVFNTGDNNGRCEYIITKNGANISTASTSAPNNQFNKNIIIRYTQTNMQVYLNGVLFFNYNYPTPADFTSILDRIEFGSLTEMGLARFDLIAIWKTALTSQQAIQLTTL